MNTRLVLSSAFLAFWIGDASPTDRPIQQQPKILSIYDASRSTLVCMKPGAEFYARGTGFGAKAGTRQLSFGGNGIGGPATIISWSDKLIHARLPTEPTIASTKSYYLAIRETNGPWLSDLSAGFVAC